jgi:hypothetical protein
LCRIFLNPDEIKALADLLDPVSIENQQYEMINDRTIRRRLEEYFEKLRLNLDNLQKLPRTAKILLIGGGQSPIKQELKAKELNISITNVDPIRYDNPEDTADHTINEDFLTADIDGKFHEIWALWSLPLYIIEPSDVNRFYKKALDSLADGGILRIYPNNLVDHDSLSFKEKLLKPFVHKESQKVIEDLKKNPNYEVDNKDSNTVTIRKKPQTTEVLS